MSDVRASGLAAGEARYSASRGDVPAGVPSTSYGSTLGRSDVPSRPRSAPMFGFYPNGLHWTHTEAGQAYLRRCRTGRL
ncbi:hypothetical protein SGPA1_10692 [Streptomyces misionensis JCM 4497]